MRWPFVLRVVHEQRVESFQCDLNRATDTIGEYRRQLAEQMQLNRTLTKLVVTMKRDGFTPAPKPIDPHQMSDPLDDEIAARARGNAPLRRHLLAQKAALKQAGVGDDELRTKLIEWTDPEMDD